MAIVEIPRMQKHNRIKHCICKEYGYRSWSHARTEAPKDEISSILHEVIEILSNESNQEERLNNSKGVSMNELKSALNNPNFREDL